MPDDGTPLLEEAEVPDEGTAAAAAGLPEEGQPRDKDRVWRPPWDVNDPLYNDRERYLNMSYWLRQSQTLIRMLFDYGFMDLSNVGIGIKNIRRLVQVYPPEFFIKDLPWDRRYLEVVGPSGAPDLLLPEQLAGSDGKRPFEIFGYHNQKTEAANGKTGGELDLPEGSLPSVITDAGQALGFVPQDWWVFSGVKSEANARKPTGLLQMPYDKVKEAVWKSLDLSEEEVRRGEVRRAGNLQEQLDLILGIRSARRSVAGLDVLYNPDHRPLEVRGYCLHKNCWQAFNEYRKLELEELELEKAKKPTEEIKRLKESKRLILFNTGERFDHMQLARGLAEVIPDPRSWAAGHPSFVNTQTVKESIAAEEALLDMVSTVLPGTEPLLAIYTEEVKKDQERYFVRILHVETVVFASIDELNDLRKTVDHRKQWLSLERAKALARIGPNDVTGRPDKWYLGSTDPTHLKDLTFPGIDPASHLGYAWELAQEWSRLTGGDALDYELPPAPQIGGWHLRLIQALSDSFDTLLEMAEQVRNGGAITDKDMREKYLPALVQYEPEVAPGVPSVVWTFWEYSEEGFPKKPNAEPGPGLVPHAVPYRDIALWYDWWWTMGNDQYVYSKLVEYMNRKFAEAGLPEAVRVTADGPASNYFRHHDIARAIYENQPLAPIRERIKRAVKEERDNGELLVRKTIELEFKGLPGRFIHLKRAFFRYAESLAEKWQFWKSHGYGAARGFSFADSGKLDDMHYGRGFGKLKDWMRRTARRHELALNNKWGDPMRGILEETHVNPVVISSPEKFTAYMGSFLRSRSLNEDFARHATTHLKVLGVLPAEWLFPWGNDPRVTAFEVWFANQESALTGDEWDRGQDILRQIGEETLYDEDGQEKAAIEAIDAVV